jgi:NhaA family Na+:H+ antiporter
MHVIRAFLRRFVHGEATGGVLLFLAAVAALAWVYLDAGSYAALFSRPLDFAGLPPVSLRAVINDGLMALFFFAVGMEIQNELVRGELSSVPKAMLPAIAAVGGMAVPASLFVAFNAGSPAVAGWAIPMATDIAFCVGLLALLRDRIPRSLVVFVTALAVFDDIGGILVIALFYGSGIQLGWLAAAGALVVAAVLARRACVGRAWVWVALGLALWWTVHGAGIHATLAGVVLGLCVPTSRAKDASSENDVLLRYLRAIHPSVTFLVLPLFALANSGIDLAGLGLESARSPVAAGIAVALIVGKPIGIVIPTLIAVRAGLGTLPGGASRVQLLGVSFCAGIGFTVSLFIANLAYAKAPETLEEAKLGIVAASALAAIAGFVVLRTTRAHPASV